MEFEPRTMGQKVCNIECAIAFGRKEKAKAQRLSDKKRRESLKSNRELADEAQRAFNRYIRVRDRGRGCISCGKKNAGQYHAGHYRTVKAAPQLRFDVRGCHAQCAQCNNFDSGNVVEYRIRLVERLGAEVVERLECTNHQPNFSADYLRRLKAVFSRRARHLERLRLRIQQRDRLNASY